MSTETEIVNLKLVSNLFAETDHLPLLHGRIRPTRKRDMKPGSFLTFRSGGDFLSIELVLSPSEILCYSGALSSVLPAFRQTSEGYQRFIPDYKARLWLEGYYTAILAKTRRSHRNPFNLSYPRTQKAEFLAGKLQATGDSQ